MTDATFTAYPAIDVRDGHVVRLLQGDYDRETRYADDPFALAMRYADAGAQWLHLVDLDAARAGGYTLAPLLRRIADDGRLRMQTGGGIREEAQIAALLAAGAQRVIVGSVAVKQPALVHDWLRKFGSEEIILSPDVRLDEAGVPRVAAAGWQESTGVGLDDLLAGYLSAGLAHILCTDISRDGKLSGPNTALYAALVKKFPTLQIQASGGVSSLDDLRALKTTGSAGAIVGRALYEKKFTLPEALAV